MNLWKRSLSRGVSSGEHGIHLKQRPGEGSGVQQTELRQRDGAKSDEGFPSVMVKLIISTDWLPTTQRTLKKCRTFLGLMKEKVFSGMANMLSWVECGRLMDRGRRLKDSTRTSRLLHTASVCSPTFCGFLTGGSDQASTQIYFLNRAKAWLYFIWRPFQWSWNVSYMLLLLQTV